jgi:hypothetical protein
MRKLFVSLVTAGLVLAVATPAWGATPSHFRFTLDPETVVHQPCGAVETITTTIWGAEYFDEQGNSIRFEVHFDYEGTVSFDGSTYRDDAHQFGIFTPSGVNVLDGEGFVFTIPGHGIVYQDVGHLVFDDTLPPELSTIMKSAKAAGFDSPPDAFSNALCAALTG